MVTKVETSKNAITVKIILGNGQERERTLGLSKYIKLFDDAGKETKLDAFHPGDEVCVTEKNDEVMRIRKHMRAKVRNVDRQGGTVTMQLTDKDGRENERTFRLIEGTEYIDNNGRISVLDMLRSGDDVLFVETDGKITGIKKTEY